MSTNLPTYRVRPGNGSWNPIRKKVWSSGQTDGEQTGPPFQEKPSCSLAVGVSTAVQASCVVGGQRRIHKPVALFATGPLVMFGCKEPGLGADTGEHPVAIAHSDRCIATQRNPANRAIETKSRHTQAANRLP